MNDRKIRKRFHRTWLQSYHKDPESFVVDELGLHHGKCRADIAVLNGCLMGFEIKGETDSLTRLPRQVVAYDAIFDQITIIVTERHLETVGTLVPRWWGIIKCEANKRGSLKFTTHRKAIRNRRVNAIAIAQLLWRAEAIDILRSNGEKGNIMRQPRAFLYARLVKIMTLTKLKDSVRSCLMRRTNWRRLQRPYEYGDLSQPIAKL